MYDAILTTYFPEAAVQMDFQSNVTLILENVVNVLHSHLLEGVLKQQAQSFFRIALTSVFCFDENAHVVVLIAALVDIHLSDKGAIRLTLDVRVEPLRLASDKKLIPIPPLAFGEIDAARVLMITVETRIIAFVV